MIRRIYPHQSQVLILLSLLQCVWRIPEMI